jgi:hypothetical protein
VLSCRLPARSHTSHSDTWHSIALANNRESTALPTEKQAIFAAELETEVQDSFLLVNSVHSLNIHLRTCFSIMSAQGCRFKTYDRFVSKKVVLYAFFIVKSGVKNAL